MKKEHESTEHELRLYAVKEHEIRKQLIPPLLFFVAVGGIIEVDEYEVHMIGMLSRYIGRRMSSARNDTGRSCCQR